MCAQQWFEGILAPRDIMYTRVGFYSAQARCFGSDARAAPDGVRTRATGFRIGSTARGVGTATALVLSWVKSLVRDTLQHKEKLTENVASEKSRFFGEPKLRMQLPDTVVTL